MKRYVRSSFLDDDDDENFIDIESWDHSKAKVVPAIMKALSVKKPIANIIYVWYDNEDVWEDFDSVEDFAAFLPSDIYDMLDACDDMLLADRVRKQLGDEF